VFGGGCPTCQACRKSPREQSDTKNVFSTESKRLVHKRRNEKIKEQEEAKDQLVELSLESKVVPYIQ